MKLLNKRMKRSDAAPERLLQGTQGGFTLVVLLLVLVILALIGGLVLPGIIGKAEGAKVRVIHLSANAPKVDVAPDGSSRRYCI